MDCYTLILFASMVVTTSAWSMPFYPVHRIRPIRITRFARIPPRHNLPVRHVPPSLPPEKPHTPKHEEDDDDHNKPSGVTGPVHTYVKTDKNANYKWGVRHHVGKKFAP